MEQCRICRESLENIRERLDLMLKRLEKAQRNNPKLVFFDNQEFIQIMNISKRTALQWRLEKIIGYSQIGNKIYYRLSDILILLDGHFKPSNN
jgi:hypothetical protein